MKLVTAIFSIITLSFSILFSDNKKNIDLSVTNPVPVLFQNNNTFAFNLLSKLGNSKENRVYSPFSIFTCLSMVYTGADGETEKDMGRTLTLTIGQKDLPNAFQQYFKSKDRRLKIANAVWAAPGTPFLPQYLSTLQDDFEAGATSLNFGNASHAASIINEWIDNQTAGKITQLITPQSLSRETRMVLTNTLYFKGEWLIPFDPKKTKEEPLKKLGMEEAFTTKANFSKIDGMKDLFISDVKHAALFELNENGVVAAAATSVQMNTTAFPPTFKPTPFIANRPFKFALVDVDTKGIYFLGTVVTP